MPPHVTVPIPFDYIDELSDRDWEQIEGICAAFPSFDIQVASVRRFEDSGTLWLAPEPDRPFLDLSNAICAIRPTPHRYEPVMHLTLARSDPDKLDELEKEFQSEYGSRLPISARCAEACMYVKHGGVWVIRQSFRFKQS
jgi:hypothetical protein